MPIYLFTQVLNNSNTGKIQSELSNIINPTGKIKDLEKQLEFSNTYSNRMNLAEAYSQNADYNNAIKHYLILTEDKVQNNLYARQQLIKCNFIIKNYKRVLEHCHIIKDFPEFKRSLSEFYYGYALCKLGDSDEAIAHLESIDKPYSNYQERLELAKFYLDNQLQTKAKLLLEELLTEFTYMTKPNRKIFQSTFNEVKSLIQSMPNT